jgi:hypothetical protein
MQRAAAGAAAAASTCQQPTTETPSSPNPPLQLIATIILPLLLLFIQVAGLTAVHASALPTCLSSASNAVAVMLGTCPLHSSRQPPHPSPSQASLLLTFHAAATDLLLLLLWRSPLILLCVASTCPSPRPCWPTLDAQLCCHAAAVAALPIATACLS